MKAVIKKRVAFALPDLRGGGAEVVFLRLLEALKGEYDLYLLVGMLQGERVGQIPQHVTVLGLKHKVGLKSVPELVRSVKDNKIDVLIGTLSMAHAVAIASVFFRKESCLCISRIGNTLSKDLDNFTGLKKILQTLYQVSLRFSDYVVVQSDYMRLDYINHVSLVREDRVRKIYNPIPESTLRLLSLAEPDVSIGEDDIVFVGRLTYQKDIMTAVKAFEIYNMSCPNSCLHILGDGLDRKTLELYISRSDIERKVFVHGFRENPYAIFSRAKIVLSSSLYEGFSNVILEAIALQKPVVATNCPGGNREVIEEGVNGYLYEIGDHSKAAEFMLKVDELSGVGQLKKCFRLDSVIDKYMRLIDER